MADNTQLNSMTGGDIISSDVITTLNGGAIATGEKAQRVKVGWGVDATLTDVTTATPLPVDASILPKAITATTGTLTTAAQTVSASVATAGGVSLAVSGTYASAVLIFEASVDNANWAPIRGQRSDNNVAESQTDALTNTIAIWDFPATGITNIRVRCVSITSGTVSVSINPTAISIEPTPSATVFSAEKDITTITAGALNADLIPSTDMLGYKVAYLQVTGTFVGTLTYQGSNDNTTFVSVLAYSISGDSLSSTTTTVTQVEIPIRYKYLRVRMTAYTSGTATGAVRYSSGLMNPRLSSLIAATQSGTWTVGVTGYPTAAASADALANPTITQIGADNMLFNGTSWDRQRGMSVATTTGDTGAKTATGNGATITNVGNKGIQIVIAMGAVTGTTPTCVLKVQGSVDGGTNWVDIPGATTASLVATGVWGISIYPGQVVTAGSTTTGTTATANGVIPRTWRMVWTIGGTTPSFTITSITYNYLPN